MTVEFVHAICSKGVRTFFPGAPGGRLGLRPSRRVCWAVWEAPGAMLGPSRFRGMCNVLF